jgi:PAS domain S-box-containing protein
MRAQIPFVQFLDAVPDAIIVVEADGRIVAVNGQAERLFGFARHELIGRPVEILMPERSRPAHLGHRASYARTPSVRPMGVGLELAGLRKDGTEFPVEISLSPVDVEGEAVTMAAIRDITERKKAEAERANLIREQTARAEAETASRAKDQFLAVLSHELRTPLQAMMGWAHLLKSGRLNPVASQHALGVVIQNVRHQTQLVTDLLDVSRIITGNLRLEAIPLELPLVIETALDGVRPLAQAKGVRLTSLLDPDVGLVMGDADRLKQVAWNLLSNAVKFTPGGGRVDVRLDRWNGRARLVVHDTGRGIAPEFRPHVFERFKQADSSATRFHGGLGLGLAISRHLVELHGGTIGVESPGEGGGATFTVELPLSVSTTPQPGAPGRREDEVPQAGLLAGMRVLVVDDDPETLEVLAAVLAQQGASVMAAASAREAFERLDAEAVDVLVSDIAMPGEDGYRFIQKVRGAPRLSSIPAVAVTAYARREDRDEALRAGYHSHITKPVEPDELAREVARLGRRP